LPGFTAVKIGGVCEEGVAPLHDLRISGETTYEAVPLILRFAWSSDKIDFGPIRESISMRASMSGDSLPLSECTRHMRRSKKGRYWLFAMFLSPKRPGDLMKVANHIMELRYNTPMVRLGKLSPPDHAEVLAKLEFFSPSSSVKDRIALHMIEEAERRGKLRPGYRIVEASTGNTGVTFSLAAAIKGYPITIVMPRKMSEERKMVMRAYGAKLIFTPGGESDVSRALALAKKILSEEEKTWMPGQFDNRDNISAHEMTTGPEIVEQAGEDIKAFVTGVGTGGTLTGVARYLKGRGIDATSWLWSRRAVPRFLRASKGGTPSRA